MVHFWHPRCIHLGSNKFTAGLAILQWPSGSFGNQWSSFWTKINLGLAIILVIFYYLPIQLVHHYSAIQATNIPWEPQSNFNLAGPSCGQLGSVRTPVTSRVHWSIFGNKRELADLNFMKSLRIQEPGEQLTALPNPSFPTLNFLNDDNYGSCSMDSQWQAFTTRL